MEKSELNNNTVIKNISCDQSEILYNIMQLHNNGQPFECDITASELKFYKKGKKDKYDIPIPKILMDVYPLREDIIKITPFQKLPLEDNSISSIVVDLPFVISPKDCKSKIENKDGSNLISNRFSSFYPADELFENIYWWIKECYRVVKDGGIVVWKFQSTVSGGRECWGAPFSFMVADKVGFYIKDEFILEAKARLISASKINKQKHARKYTSTFWVFQKDPVLAGKNSCFRWLELCEKQNLEGKVWDDTMKNKEINKELDLKYISKSKRRQHKDKNIEESTMFELNREKYNKKIEEETKLTYYEQIKQKVRERHQNHEENKNVVEDKKPDVIEEVKKINKIQQFSLDGNLIKEWNTYSEITKELGISSSSLSQCIRGKIKTSGGYIWKKI